MQKETQRSRARMILGQWGGWMVLLGRLERELSAARGWIARAEDEDMLRNARTLEAQILAEIGDLLRMRGSVACLLERLDAAQQQVLILRYEKKLSWVQIGIRMNYDERTVRRLEEKAVDIISEGLIPSAPPRP